MTETQFKEPVNLSRAARMVQLAHEKLNSTNNSIYRSKDQIEPSLVVNTNLGCNKNYSDAENQNVDKKREENKKKVKRWLDFSIIRPNGLSNPSYDTMKNSNPLEDKRQSTSSELSRMNAGSLVTDEHNQRQLPRKVVNLQCTLGVAEYYNRSDVILGEIQATIIPNYIPRSSDPSVDTDVSENVPVDAMIMSDPSVYTNVSEDAPVDGMIISDPSVDTDVSENAPVDAMIMSDPSVDTDVSEDAPVDAMIRSDSSVATDVSENAPVDAMIMFNPPIDADISETAPIDINVSNLVASTFQMTFERFQMDDISVSSNDTEPYESNYYIEQFLFSLKETARTNDNDEQTSVIDNTEVSVSIDREATGEKENDENLTIIREPDRSRKRRRACVNEWKRNVQKRLRNAGEEYTSSSKKKIPAKSFYNFVCHCKCTEKVSVEERKSMFDLYWKSSREAKLAYLCGHVKQSDVGRRYTTTGDTSRRKKTRVYFATTENGGSQKVCKASFLKTLQISNGSLDRALKCELRGTFKELRGTGTPKNKLQHSAIVAIRNHIGSFPQYESHYCRASAKNVQFLPQSLNLCLMHRLYQDQQHISGNIAVSLSKYKQVFYTEFNLKFKKPKKDTCNKCDNFYIQLEAHKDQPEEYKKVVVLRDEHQGLAKYARDMLKDERQAAKDQNSRCQVITFDLQSVLPTPRLTSNVVYYKRQLSVYNLGIHDCKEEKGIMFVWHEGLASRGSQEISSCLHKFVHSDYCNHDKTELIAWSDSCGGQNRNIKVAISMLKIVQDPMLLYSTITQKFLVSGHSFLPNDSDFGDIEKRAKFHPEIYTPSHWYKIMKEAKVSSPSFDVVEMKREDFLSTKQLEGAITNRKHTVDGVKINWLNMRQIQVRREKEGSLFFRYTYSSSEEWKEISIAKRGKKLQSVLQMPLYNSLRPLTDAKKRDIMSLMLLIPPIHHPFYESLKGAGKDDDDIDGLPADLDFEMCLSDTEKL